MFSIDDEEVPWFRLLRMRARRMPGLIADARIKRSARVPQRVSRRFRSTAWPDLLVHIQQ